MQQNNKRKRRFGDRNDGRLVRSLDPLVKMMAYIMPQRNDALNSFRGKMDVGMLEEYVRGKRDMGLKNFTTMHALVAAYTRMVSQRPALNRFIAGQRIYARNEFQVELAIKKTLSLDGQETVLTMKIPLDSTADQVYAIIENEINKARSETTNFDNVARYIDLIPGLIKKFTLFNIRVADYFGLLPKWLTDLSPFHGSMFITSMASLGLPAIYHHIYNLGTVPVFLAMGSTQKECVQDANGNMVTRRMMDYTAVMDERICDGYNYASAFRLLNHIVRNPHVLDVPPEKVEEDVD